MPCTDPTILLLEPFRPLFTAPTWKKLLTLFRGTLLARGRRTVTAALWQTGHDQDAHFSAFHQVLNRAHWSPLEASRHLLTLLVDTFLQAGETLDLVIDETLERRWGAKIRKRGHYRDSALSSHERSVSSPGLRGTRTCDGRSFAVDTTAVGLALFGGAGHDPRGQPAPGGAAPHDWDAGVPTGEGAASLAARQADQAPGDMAYSVLDLGLHCTRSQITLIAPLRLDAVLHLPTSARRNHTLGRPRVVGPRLPSLEHLLHHPRTVWQQLMLDWHGEGKRAMEICTGTAWWYRFGYAPLPIRWVLTRDPEGKRPAKALFSTDPTQAAAEIVGDFMKRWSLETTFEESRAHLGIETQRQWSDLAIERTTPLLFGLYNLVTLCGKALAPAGHLPLKHAVWYHKQTATFSDVLALVRRQLWGNFTFPTSPSDPDVVLVPRSVLNQLAHAVCY